MFTITMKETTNYTNVCFRSYYCSINKVLKINILQNPTKNSSSNDKLLASVRMHNEKDLSNSYSQI
jgi:hypothetical protein